MSKWCGLGGEVRAGVCWWGRYAASWHPMMDKVYLRSRVAIALFNLAIRLD